ALSESPLTGLQSDSMSFWNPVRGGPLKAPGGVFGTRGGGAVLLNRGGGGAVELGAGLRSRSLLYAEGVAQPDLALPVDQIPALPSRRTRPTCRSPTPCRCRGRPGRPSAA